MRASREGRSGAYGRVDGAVEALFRAEFEPMFRLAFTLVGSEAIAEEVVQDAFVGVARRWASIDNPGGYLRVSVVNGARKRLRSRSRQAEMQQRLAGAAEAVEPGEVPYLLDVVDGLPERQRTAIVLVYYGGMSSEEAGDVMGLSAATVRSHVRRALGKLAEVIER